MLEAATAGLGVAIAPEILVRDDIAAGQLAAPLGLTPSGMTYVALLPPGRNRDAKTFANWLGDAERRGGSPLARAASRGAATASAWPSDATCLMPSDQSWSIPAGAGEPSARGPPARRAWVEAPHSAIVTPVAAAIERGMTDEQAVEAAGAYIWRSVPDAVRKLRPDAGAVAEIERTKDRRGDARPGPLIRALAALRCVAPLRRRPAAGQGARPAPRRRRRTGQAASRGPAETAGPPAAAANPGP